MKKILFLIHDLGQGGAEKVLVNLVNHMDQSKFDITVMAMFGGGVNEQFLNPSIRYLTFFKRMIPGNSRWMKLITPKQLHKIFIKERYDVEISYLEGPSARVIAGCCNPGTRTVSWMHEKQRTKEVAACFFRSKKEAEWCYGRFDRHIFVSEAVMRDFVNIFPQENSCHVLYNTVESDHIFLQSREKVNEIIDNQKINLCAVGTLKQIKGFDRLLRIILRLKNNGYEVMLYLLGQGPLEEELKAYTEQNGLNGNVIFLGYQTNPYKYVAKCDLFVCASHAEGFSTAATEALIVGTPVCTVEVSGMKEMLGENNEYGIVTENDEEALYQGIKRLLDDPKLLAHYKKQAEIRGKAFSTENTVRAVEKMLLSL